MVAELWIHKMRKKKTQAAPPKRGGAGGGPPATIGILSFEVAAAMSRAASLHRSLSDAEMARLRAHALSSPGVRALVSSSDSHLLALTLAEKLDDLNRVAAAAARLGLRCAHPTLSGFEHVYADLLAGRIPSPAALGFLSKDIHGSVRRMERLVASTSALYAELEALTDLEQSARKFPAADDARRVLDQKIQWHRHDIKLLRDASLWNQPYDKAVLLLARSVCTIHARIRHVFGEAVLGLDALVPPNDTRPLFLPRRHLPLHSGPIEFDPSEARPQSFRPDGLRMHCGASPGKIFMECLSLASSADSRDHLDTESCLSAIQLSGNVANSRFGPKSRLTSLAPPSTIGGSALALHYANVIIIIEKLLRYPHLVGEEARDDLYQMLPSSLRSALRKSLRSYVKNLSIYDAPLAHDWKEAMNNILSWLAPMAHNMIRWQTERNFEQQQIVSRANILLLETLYFADREKTEAAICELLVGLNYICRYEQQQNALLDCTSSLDFDDCMDWQLQF